MKKIRNPINISYCYQKDMAKRRQRPPCWMKRMRPGLRQMNIWPPGGARKRQTQGSGSCRIWKKRARRQLCRSILPTKAFSGRHMAASSIMDISIVRKDL